MQLRFRARRFGLSLRFDASAAYTQPQRNSADSGPPTPNPLSDAKTAMRSSFPLQQRAKPADVLEVLDGEHPAR